MSDPILDHLKRIDAHLSQQDEAIAALQRDDAADDAAAEQKEKDSEVWRSWVQWGVWVAATLLVGYGGYLLGRH